MTGFYERIFGSFAVIAARQMKPGFLHNKRYGSVLPSASLEIRTYLGFSRLWIMRCVQADAMLGGSLGEVRGIFSGDDNI